MNNDEINTSHAKSPLTSDISFALSLVPIGGLLLLTGLCSVGLGSDVSGTIVNQVWTSNNSPYRVVGDIQVAGLAIQPGVIVLMSGNYVFEVAGTLKAIGTPTSPILFTTANGGWQGLFFNSAQPGCELAHCIIEKSVNTGIRIVSSTPVISDCVIRSNTITMQGEGDILSLEANGGGIKTDSPLVLDNCVIQNNSVVASVGAEDATAITKGGGIYSTAPLTLFNCTVSSNSLSARCGSGANGESVCEGAGVWAGTNLTVQSCLIEGNFSDADSMAGGFSYATNLGAGIFSRGPSIHRNSIFARNTAIGSAGFPFNGGNLIVKGGGMYVAGSAQSVENSTIAFNNPDGLATDTNATQVLNSIVWGNVTNQIVGATNVTYCDVQGGMAGVGNKNANPIFLSSSDLLIVSGSPCINAGDTNAAFTNVFFPPSLGKIHNDMGAHGGPGAGARLRPRDNQQMEVVFLGGVPGYNYQIQASTDLLNWQTVEQAPIAHLGDYATFLEPTTNTLPHRFYRLNSGQ
jgi:hypothetical protein